MLLTSLSVICSIPFKGWSASDEKNAVAVRVSSEAFPRLAGEELIECIERNDNSAPQAFTWELTGGD